MSDQPEHPWLIALAGDVGDGRPVDWGEVQQSADPKTEGILRGLQRIASVVDAHRKDFDPPHSTETPAFNSKVWRHLILLEIVGTGAFGTVYRAWDPHLEREVALKLHAVFPGRAPLAEAQHHARIRHPNVVAVYGAEQHDTQVGIWMEFIEGETLATFVQQRGPMSAREVAAIGIDACRALTALHSAGLLHRDIKAQNVMREVGGRIVLMDFSGAGAFETEGSVAELSGTPLYMAPELFEGQPASPRTDTYSLGVLLFYLFSGRMPIEGAMLSDVRRAHKTGKRLRLRDLRPELPDTVVQIVERAAHPDPATRYATTGDLEQALAGILGSSVMAPVSAEPAPVRHRARTAILRALTAVTTLAVLILLAVPLLGPYRATVRPLDVQFTIGPPFNAGPWPRVSPDGRSVVFGAPLEGRPVLWVRPLRAVESRPIPSAGTVETPFWSPDGRQLAFLADEKLKIVDIESGRSETLAAVLHMAGGDWNKEGVLIFATDTGIDRIRADGTDRRHVTTLDRSRGEYRQGWPEFLPDGRRFLFVGRSKLPDQSWVYLGSLDSPDRKRILPAYSRVAYSASGHLIYVRNGTLMAQPFDQRSADLTGEPIALGGPIKYHTADDGAFDVSGNGVLIYRSMESPVLTRLAVLDRRGRELQSLAPTGSFGQPRLSPDGTRVAAEKVTPDSFNPDIWVFDLERRNSIQLTHDLAPDVHPVWSPDGHSILFSSKRASSFDVYRRSIEDPRDETLVWRSDDNKRLEDVSRDGRLLLVSTPRKGLWTVSADDTSRQSLVQTTTGSDNGMQAEFSPDAKFVAYASEESGRPEVYVETQPRTDARWQLSTSGGAEPHWRGDGKELFFLSGDGWLMTVAMPGGVQWKPGHARRLFRVTVPKLFGGSNYAVSQDGERFVVNLFVAEAAVPAIQVVVNHPTLLKQ